MLSLPFPRTVVLSTTLLCFVLCFTNCRKDLKNETELSLSKDASLQSSLTLSGKPNIILFLANDVGYEVPTFTGGHSYQTPTLDMMAANGIFFTHTYRHPDGFPSRLAFYTGKYNFRNYDTWAHYSYQEKTFANMLSDAGYKTCYVGKWQQADGDYGITHRGWQKYRVFLPFQNASQRKGRYKDPVLFEAGAYLPESVTKGKYSEDMFSDYLCNFIDDNKGVPFLSVYSFNLAASPYVPTPDDPEFANWDPAHDNTRSNTKYFPGMVKYMDKMINKVITKLKADGIANNTYIFYLSPTATQEKITSVWGPNNDKVTGSKLQTQMWGTLNSLVVYCPAKVSPRIDRTTLIDFTDFLPTIAALTKTPKPTTYGILDGVNFADNIKGTTGANRNWVFCHWDNNDTKEPPLQRWVNDTTYKLYDTLNYSQFYNMVKDTFERSPIPDSKLTPQEKQIKQNFIGVLQKMHN
jgi:arylsulfatase A